MTAAERRRGRGEHDPHGRLTALEAGEAACHRGWLAA